METGPVWHGWDVPRTDEDRARLRAVVDGLIAARADVALVLRPGALRPEQLRRLREAGVRTVAWFADDPVFFEVQSRRVARHYDLTLHTASAPVLELYEHELGVRGLNLPFWADQERFPRLYDPAVCDLDLVFVGNTHTEVKAWRYDWLAALPVSRAMYGQAKADPAGIVAGVAQDDAELARACARGRLGLNISQRFADYAGSRFDFPGLAELGEFPLPSRIPQLAATGVPVLALVASDDAAADLAGTFPPVLCVRDAEEAVAVLRATTGDVDRLRALSEETHAWYARHYTPGARARFLDAVLADPRRFTRLGAEQRALAFLDAPTPSVEQEAHARARVRRAERLRPLLDARRVAVGSARRAVRGLRRRVVPGGTGR